MHVVATAGHVDHGKSTLVRALTGMEPDRWAEERRRGMTIDLGFAWTTLPSGRVVAFVDVPGHERFITNMLAGVGPAPSVLLVVAADEGWMAQTDEHMRVVAALGRAQVLLVVTKGDIVASDAARDEALARLESLGIAPAAVVEASGVTGHGLSELRAALDQFVAAQPPPALDAPVRLWVDRSFTIRGAGTVVTGTLDAGRVCVGDTLMLEPASRRVEVRGLQSLHHECDVVDACARVAINLRGVARSDITRGMALTSPGAWTTTDHVDVVGATENLPDAVVVHVGSAAVTARRRRLGPDAARLRLATPLPLHLGDRLLLRDPAGRRVAAVDVADLWPQPIARRGDAARIAASLTVPTTADELIALRGVCSVDELAASGLDVTVATARRVGRWLLSAQRWEATRAGVSARVTQACGVGVGVAAVAHDLELPSPDIVVEVAREMPGLVVADGRLHGVAAAAPDGAGLTRLLKRLDEDPFDAPDSHELSALGVERSALAAAVRSGRLSRLTEGVYVGARALDDAVRMLGELPQPFGVSDARDRLGSSRRVVVPLLEHLDAARRTRRLPDGQRVVVRPEA